MTLADIIQLVQLKLGEQTVFYPEAEIVRGGINPAQRILCLAAPDLFQQRTTVTVQAEQPFIDLRTLLDSDSNVVGNRIRRVNRVVLGDITGDMPLRSIATGEYRELTSTSLPCLVARNNWLSERGPIRKYWMWGRIWLGLYKRPIDVTTLTIMFDATPVPLDVNVLTASPSVQDVFHTVIAEVAAGLLLMKEGSAHFFAPGYQPLGAQGVQRVIAALNLESQVAAQQQVAQRRAALHVGLQQDVAQQVAAQQGTER